MTILVWLYYLLPETAIPPHDLSAHIMMEFAAAILAVVGGVLAMVRFYTKNNNTYLFIGIGLLGAGLLDIYYVTTLLRETQGLFNSPTHAMFAWTWNLSRTFLAVLLLISWLQWYREKKPEASTLLTRGYIVLALIIVTLVHVLLFIRLPVVPQPTTSTLGRLEIFFSATCFLWALVGFLDKKIWQVNRFDHWIILSLILSYAGQTFFLFPAYTSFVPLLTVAHVLKLLSYLCIFVGLLISIFNIIKRAEQHSTQLATANESLQREIAERFRAEKAEHEHRQLAEALREVGNALSSTLEFNHLLDGLLDQIARVLPYDTANVMLVEGNMVNIVCTRGYGVTQPGVPTQFALSTMPTLERMANTGQPFVVPDTTAHPEWVQAEASPHVCSWAGAPIMVQREVVAFLALNHSQPGFYQLKDAPGLTAFAGQASIAIQNARLYEALQKRVAELTTLNRISQLVTSTLDLQTTLRFVTQHTTDLLDVAATSVVLVDKENGDLWFAAASGEAADFVLGKRLALGQGILGWVAQEGQPVLVPDVRQDTRYFAAFDEKSGFTASSILCVPLQAKDETIGAIETLNKKSGPFDEEDLRLLTRVANPAAVAIENARLYEQAQQEINERKRAESALEAERALLTHRVEERTAALTATNSELERAMHLKDEFLASMSHELRTPLNTILGMSDALQEDVYGPMNEKQRSSLKHIETSGRHLLALINDILDVSKVEAGKLELELEPVSVEAVCQASLNFIKGEAQKKRLNIQFQRDSFVSVIQADERRLKQILVNLLSNAVKFTPSGGQIGLDVRGDEASQTLSLTVWDTGIGIAPEDRERLFQPFVQLDSALSRQYTGTGLGLSLVSRLTALHGGQVSLESVVGQGSRFTVTLPWLQGNILVGPGEGQAMVFHGPVSHQATVLIAEDNEVIATALDEYLRFKGYQVLLAQNGYEAIERTLASHPDVVLMDIQMPGLDGLEAIRRIRADQSNVCRVPIIALTALALSTDKDKCLQAGANRYISKPVGLTHLIHMIEDLLAEKI
ncbi:MAG: GAF domain-containing protein [Chloroflexi bacterium]|nr:GAF domain-containing protein [Chloroflexota bacterium]